MNGIEWHIIEETDGVERFRKPYTRERAADRAFEILGGLFIADTRYAVSHVGCKPNEAWCITGPTGEQTTIRLRRIMTI